jgi:adenine-specific DNA-methyltransferase
VQLLIQTPAKVLNKAYLKQNVQQNDILRFQDNIHNLFERLNPNESEENQKNLVCDFLKDSYYKDRFEINTSGREDLAIHRGKTAKDVVGVIIENKRIDSPEMMSHIRPNVKALHELILYYFVEREVKKNIEISHLIATDLHNWYVFDENDFRKIFYENKAFKKIYQTKTEQNKDNGFFYTEVKKLIETLTDLELPCAYFSFDTKKRSDAAQIALYKLLSPEHLLKLPFENDANSLNREFYNELLYIIGLEEVKDGGKKIIQRKTSQNRLEGSLLENAINEIEVDNALFNLDNLNQYGQNQEEQLFNVGLELCITWLNRILFLKLLEGQLIKYHRGDTAFAFLNESRVKDFDELSELFFEVLAVPTSQRKPSVTERYGNIPYLNSSLFELTELERRAVKIKDLKDRLGVPIYAQSVLKGDKGKRKQGEMSTVKYLFEFLDAYDFASDSSAQIQEQAKTIINASVLGLIFEKINGYHDGSFFTPGFITMYMCRETLRKAVLEKFRGVYVEANITSFDDLKAFISESGRGKRKEFNDLVNSLRVCDPAVGSGHFLVSALNELIAIKHDLNILLHRDGSKVVNYQITIENDELIILDEENDQLFEYRLNAANKPIEHLQKLQETLFHEKETIIENCLFGVDINPNSVKICRLRLWIELLKNAYYKSPLTPRGGTSQSDSSTILAPPLGVGGLLVTLPNIDINIKTGNSLVARFGLEEDLSEVFKKQKFSVKDYKQAVYDYKNSPTKERKAEVLRFIDDIKSEFVQTVYKKDARRKQINNLRGQLMLLQTQNVDIFGNKIKEDAEIETIRLEKLISQREAELENAINSPIYRNAFEWRFEFPEVLDEEGKFVGFDAVVGNPPYFSLSKIKEYGKEFETNYFTYSKSSDIYCLFYEKGIQIVKNQGLVTYITSNSWLKTQYGESLRVFFENKTNPLILINIEDAQIFEEATVESNILIIKNDNFKGNLEVVSLKKDFKESISIDQYFTDNKLIINELDKKGWNIGNQIESDLKRKFEDGSKLLKDWENEINYGVKTGLNEAFMIDEKTKNEIIENDPKSAEIIRPVLRGRDLSKFNYVFGNQWVIVAKYGSNEILENNYPAIFRHLKSFEEKLKIRGQCRYGGKNNLGMHHWLELDNCPKDEYLSNFEQPKIIWGELSDKAKFTIDEEGYYPNNTIFMLTGKSLKFLLAVLNSKAAQWYFELISTTSGMGTNRWLKYKIEQLPIKEISETEQQPFINLVEKILSLKSKNPQADTQAFEDEIDELVFGLYGLSAEERAVVLGRK